MDDENLKKILEKKFDEYRFDNAKDLKAPGELTVTITLCEYRELVTNVARSEARIEAERKKRREAEDLLDTANRNNDFLKNQLLVITNDLKGEVVVDETDQP